MTIAQDFIKLNDLEYDKSNINSDDNNFNHSSMDMKQIKEDSVIEIKSEIYQDISSNLSPMEVQMLNEFMLYASNYISNTYLSMKKYSFIFRTTSIVSETIVQRSGLQTVFNYLFNQWIRCCGPIASNIDKRISSKIISIAIDMLSSACKSLESNENNNKEIITDYNKRLAFFITGNTSLIIDKEEIHKKEKEMIDMKETYNTKLNEIVSNNDVLNKKLQICSMDLLKSNEKIKNLTNENAQLEQKLIDVHNYTLSERGVKFEEMESQLAKARLDLSRAMAANNRMKSILEKKSNKKNTDSSKKSNLSKKTNSANSSTNSTPRNKNMEVNNDFFTNSTDFHKMENRKNIQSA